MHSFRDEAGERCKQEYCIYRSWKNTRYTNVQKCLGLIHICIQQVLTSITCYISVLSWQTYMGNYIVGVIWIWQYTLTCQDRCYLSREGPEDNCTQHNWHHAQLNMSLLLTHALNYTNKLMRYQVKKGGDMLRHPSTAPRCWQWRLAMLWKPIQRLLPSYCGTVIFLSPPTPSQSPCVYHRTPLSALTDPRIFTTHLWRSMLMNTDSFSEDQWPRQRFFGLIMTACIAL
jgi:hypothetical protein